MARPAQSQFKVGQPLNMAACTKRDASFRENFYLLPISRWKINIFRATRETPLSSDLLRVRTCFAALELFGEKRIESLIILGPC